MTIDDSSSIRRMPVGSISLDERLHIMDTKLDTIIDKGSDIDTKVALIEDKLSLHDKILMAVCGTAGLGIVAAILKLVFKDN